MSFSYEKCSLCGRNCSVDRYTSVGFCKMSSELKIARAAPHMWEEPIISGINGSGTVFFSGCSLLCSYCQNREISRGESGKFVSDSRFVQIMLELQKQGAHNINLVTPTHYAPTIKQCIIEARNQGLNIPIVYNTSSYDSVETLKNLDGYIDVYLADFKYYLSRTSACLSHADNYPEIAQKAIEEMVRQTGEVKLGDDGMIKSGTVVRILLLPEHVAEAKLILKYLFDTYGNTIYISLMNQYTPMEGLKKPLDRRVTRKEYREFIDYALKLGVKNAFTQEEGTSETSFIPDFDNTGI